MENNYIITSAIALGLMGTPVLAQKKIPQAYKRMPKQANLFLQDGKKNLPKGKFLIKKYINKEK